MQPVFVIIFNWFLPVHRELWVLHGHFLLSVLVNSDSTFVKPLAQTSLKIKPYRES